MPTYEYRCPDGHEYEKFFRSISSGTATLSCPVCAKEGARFMSAGAGLVFKGSGFYITDYGKDGKKDQPVAAKKEGGAEGGSSGSDTSSAPASGDSRASSTETSASPATKGTDTKVATASPPPAATKSASTTSAKQSKE